MISESLHRWGYVVIVPIYPSVTSPFIGRATQRRCWTPQVCRETSGVSRPHPMHRVGSSSTGGFSRVFVRVFFFLKDIHDAKMAETFGGQDLGKTEIFHTFWVVYT